MKLYVKSGNNQRLVLASNEIEAACACVKLWKRQKRKMGSCVRVSEVGFDGDHPDHARDSVYTTMAIKKMLK